MATLVRPLRRISFSDLARQSRGQIPADQLDAQIHDLIQAIISTQDALTELRRDDGKLRNGSVGPDQLATSLRHDRSEIDSVEAEIVKTAAAIGGVASQVAATTRDIELRVKDAEIAAFAAVHARALVDDAAANIETRATEIASRSTAVEYDATQSENWANYSKAQADNAIAAKDESLQWSEYLAGPVVDSAKAPAYIAGSKFPHGLYYQPVEGGLAGLWSSKWWALYAQQLVGHWNFYYLGSWPDPPFPGNTNPDTGLTTPNPLAPGSFYYNTTNHQLYIWDGTQWTTPISLTAAYLDNFVYVATASQKAFFGPDRDGKIPTVGSSPSDVHLNGIKLVPTTDYTIDTAASKLNLVVGAPAGAIVQWDLLVPTSDLAPGAISVFKIQMTPVPDGTNRVFDMTYTHPTLGSQPVAATSIAEINISLDGIVQEPGVDFAISGGHTLTMAQPPLVGSRFWGTWHASDLIVP